MTKVRRGRGGDISHNHQVTYCIIFPCLNGVRVTQAEAENVNGGWGGFLIRWGMGFLIGETEPCQKRQDGDSIKSV